VRTHLVLVLIQHPREAKRRLSDGTAFALKFPDGFHIDDTDGMQKVAHQCALPSIDVTHDNDREWRLAKWHRRAR
jgi:hypothetical protein